MNSLTFKKGDLAKPVHLSVSILNNEDAGLLESLSLEELAAHD